ncbi:SpoIIE family protein phosphatase [Nocardioides baculatus]|uniref:SpoIIE family protein phosphatase n=1 Tax=Nocardioides baculatus TaxID=2801337 RepID=A0ABS1L9H7_9ACTN|nr:SpoIIE family protein phosphatase [Nocardioides baculatus]MBL0747592.1 SpoIIE family protein phosphatase [Nocardioides baculatus]
MPDIGAPPAIGVPAQREPVEMSAALDEESDHVALRLAIDAAGVGAFVWDLVSGRLRWDERLLELFGLDETTFGGSIEAFNECVHPDDLPRVSAALERAIATCGDYDAEYRVVMPGGAVRWIAARGRAFAETEGGPAVRLVGAAYDTTQVREGEARIGRVLESMSSAFYQLDDEWRFAYVNSEAERLLGAGRTHLVGRSVWEEFPAAVGSAFETNYREAVATGRPVSFEAYYPPPLDGWYEVRAWPSPEGLAVYFVDITERREAQDALARSAQRLALLASVSEGLTGTLDPVEGVTLLSTLLVPALADWCLVTLVDDPHAADWRRGLTDAGWTHADPRMHDTLREYASLRLRAMTDESYLARAIRDMATVLMTSDATDKVAAVLREGTARDRLHELAPESAVAVPLRARGRTVGVVTVFRGDERPAFTEDDASLLEDIAARAGLALDNARLYEEQRDVAEALQRSMLTDPPHTPHLQVVTRYSPASDAARIGGDWYDAFLQQNRGPGNNDVVVVVGDVVGHDVEAAAAMGQVRGLLRGIAVHSGYSPAAVLSGVDQVMDSLHLETTATAVVARLEHHPRPGAAAGEEVVLRWAHAGHPPAMLVGPDGVVIRLADVEDNDLLLGLDPDTKRAERAAFLEPGSTLLFYTDGLVERRGRDVEQGIADLEELLRELDPRTADLDAMCDRLLSRMIGDQPEDDVALLVVRWDPSTAA